MNKEEIFRKLVERNNVRKEYLDKIPSDISPALFDNELVNSYGMDVDMLTNFVFGDASESVYWFLYEWKPGHKVNDVPIMDIGQYITYMTLYEKSW
jgi:hypothetical protein